MRFVLLTVETKYMYRSLRPSICTDRWDQVYVPIVDTKYMYWSLRPSICNDRWDQVYVPIVETKYMYRSLRPSICNDRWDQYTNALRSFNGEDSDKYTLNSLVSELFFNRQTCNSRRRPTHYSWFPRCVQKKYHVDNFLCGLCCSVIYIITCAEYGAWLWFSRRWRFFPDFFKICCQRCSKLNPTTFDFHDTLTLHIPKSVKNVILWKDIALDI